MTNHRRVWYLAAVVAAAVTVGVVADSAGAETRPTCPEGWQDTSVGSMGFCSHPDVGSVSPQQAWWRYEAAQQRVVVAGRSYRDSSAAVAGATAAYVESPTAANKRAFDAAHQTHRGRQVDAEIAVICAMHGAVYVDGGCGW